MAPNRIDSVPTSDNQTLEQWFWMPEPSNGAPIRCKAPLHTRGPAPSVTDETTFVPLLQTSRPRREPPA
jgi:hypothetical protein